jgi:ABC-type enterobactin transport system permease subunit
VLAAGPVSFVAWWHRTWCAWRCAPPITGWSRPPRACGGSLLCLADIASRTVAAPRQLPVGAITR